METTISSKYQVVIPKEARERLNLRPSQKLRVLEKSGVLYLIPEMSIDDLRGMAAGEPVRGYRDKKDRIR